MRILIASTIVPFIEGGGTFIVDWLQKGFQDRGYQCEVIKLPFHSCYPEMLQQMLGFRLIDLEGYTDLLITIRTPSYLLKHPNKIAWFIHHHRGAYDLWGTQYQDIPNTYEGLQVRNSIIAADNVALRECKKIYTNSLVVSDRLREFNNLESEVLYPPLYNSHCYHCNGYEDFIFYPSRITSHKRQILAIEAMQYTKSEVKLLIAGSPDDPVQLAQLQNEVQKSKAKKNITIISRWISDQEKYEFFSRCLGGLYIPHNEDSYGYPTLEAFQSKKPVITCIDSGGTLEIIENNVNGFITESTPQSLAYAMDLLYMDREKARELGEEGFLSISKKGINFDHIIQKMVQ